MKRNNDNMATFEMVIENNNSFVIKKIYPENLSEEEIEKAEKDVPKVILHCFEPAKVAELQIWGEKIAKQHLDIQSMSKKNKRGLYTAIKSIFF